MVKKKSIGMSEILHEDIFNKARYNRFAGRLFMKLKKLKFVLISRYFVLADIEITLLFLTSALRQSVAIPVQLQPSGHLKITKTEK